MVERRHFTYTSDSGGKRKKQFDELPEIVDNFIYKITNKRMDVAESSLINELLKETDKLFKLVVVNSMNVAGPSSEIQKYLSSPWRPLSRKWLAKKKPVTTFWYGSENKRTSSHLKDYLTEVAPMTIFGTPDIKIARNLRAKGYQRATISINPYPLRREDLKSNMDSDQYAKLFGIRRDGVSNEDDRPLISPAIKYMIENHLRKVVNRVMKESIRTGEEVKFSDL